MRESPWNSLEIAKLLLQALTPLAVAILGIYLSRVAKRFEHLQWRNQRLIEKRIAIYDDLAPRLNDLLCYFTYVGCWKDLTPPQVVTLKRDIDKTIYLAAPLFSVEFFTTSSRFISLCFAPFQRWGADAKLKTKFERRKQAAADAWDITWETCFATDDTDPNEVRRAYQDVMAVFAQDLGLNPDRPRTALGPLPSNIR